MPTMTFDHRLRPDCYPSVIQDGRSIAAEQIRAMADRGAARLAGLRGGRVALATRRVDAIVAAIQACQVAGCDLLLLREAPAHGSPTLSAWQVTGVLDDDLHVTPVGNPSPGVAEPCILLPTSGTTGTPKIVRHHLGILLMSLSRYVPPDRRRTLIGYHPVSFAGLRVVIAAMVAGGQLIALSEQTLSHLAEAAATFAPNEFRGTPTVMRSLLSLLGGEASKLTFDRVGLSGETIDQLLLDRLRALLPNAALWQIYGTSETGSFLVVKDGQAGFPARWIDEGLGPVRLRIVDGVLEVASPIAMLGYLGGPMRRPEDPPAWWSTDDMIGIEGDRARFLGRADSVINVGGAKVRPEEVEQALLAVAGVMDARVFGRHNPITGQLVAAEVAAMPDVDHAALRERIQQVLVERLERYKVPRFLQITSALAIDPSGKKSRREQPE
jgi:acyl-coenzyme A synthetase/AMP-(fatty) acid ligase